MGRAKRTTSGKKPAETQTSRIIFNLNAPEAQEVTLSGSFNGWDPKARALKCGKFSQAHLAEFAARPA